MNLDMHFHSISSDWYSTKTELLQKAKEKNMDFIALTDHDVISYWFREETQRLEIESCQSVEISSYNKAHNKSLHLTFYAKEISTDISSRIQTIIDAKIGLLKKQVLFFKDIWFDIDILEMYNFYDKSNRNKETLNKFDLVRFMFLKESNRILAQKINNNIPINIEWFYLKFLKRWWEFFDKYAVIIDAYEMPIESCSDFVTQSNWVLSIAHPNVTFRKWWIQEFQEVLPFYIEKAWINAIEINAKATQNWVEAILEAKNNYWLFLTFWSDFHKEGIDDWKHWEFWEKNIYTQKDFIKSCFEEYREKIIA